MKYPVGYAGKNIINKKELVLLGIEDDSLYHLKYPSRFSSETDNEKVVSGKNLLKILQTIPTDRNIQIQGPIAIRGESQ